MVDFMRWVSLVATVILTAVAIYRWLRVSQREHYGPGRATSIASQWLKIQPRAVMPWFAAVAVWLALSFVKNDALGHILVAALAALSPLGMPIVKTDQKLVITPRVWRMIAVLAVIVLIIAAIRGNPRWVSVLALVSFACVDFAALIMKPVERALSMKFVKQATGTLQKVDPQIIAITGSYGKTTTKNYTAHMLNDVKQTVATPGSFNNLLGLTRSVNEKLHPGAEVFIAEMGTYGPGEIAELCTYFPPKIAAIVTIGEAHLERMGNRETIVRAKREILDGGATTWVLNTDVEELAEIADSAPHGITVVRCSNNKDSGADITAQVADGRATLTIGDSTIDSEVPQGVHPINVAIAAGLAHAAGASINTIKRALPKLPVVTSRGVSARTENGVTIIDDTFNSNPTGAARALATAHKKVTKGKTLWVVTPGMFELGSAMHERNKEWAQQILTIANARFVAVGGTNQQAFEDALSAPHHKAMYRWFGTRPAAVQFVLEQVEPGDVVLYENDRPDHLP